jgi:hypothetical protein
MSKYTGPFDANYKTVVDTIKGFIEFSSTRQLWNMVRRTDAPSTEEGESEQRERLSELLARGADPNLWNYNGKSALHLAVQSQNDLAVPMLVWEGAELNLPDGDGETALQIAVAERMKDPRNVKSEEIYQILRQTGAIMNAREGVHQPPKQEDLEPLTSSYYIEGKRLDPRGAPARRNFRPGPSEFSPDCKEACRNFDLIINSFCPSQTFPLRGYHHTETVFVALYADESKDIFPPPLPQVQVPYSPISELDKADRRGTRELQFYMVPSSNKQCI